MCEEDVIDEAAVARARAAISGERSARALTGIFRALADPTRLRVLEALSAGELCVCDIAAAVGVSQSAVSHQLRVLRDLDLVYAERQGKRAVYRLADDHVRALLAQGAEHASERVAQPRGAAAGQDRR